MRKVVKSGIAVVVLLLAACSFWQGTSQSELSSLQSEISEVSLSQAANVDITKLVKKYIPVGTPEAEARSVLNSSGFQIHESSQKLEDQSFLAVWTYEKSIFSHRKARIVFTLRESKVVDIVGHAGYYSL